MNKIPVVFAKDLPTCECCDEPWCPIHEKHFADCLCIGPNNAEEEGYDMFKVRGKWWARKKIDKSRT